MKTFNQLLENLSKSNTVYYHVSPLPKFDGTYETSVKSISDLYDREYDKHEQWKESDEASDATLHEFNKREHHINQLGKMMDSYIKNGRIHANISNISKSHFYATSQPEYWRDVNSDELGVDYTHGGIYKVELHSPQAETNVPSGMGQEAPQTIIHLSNVKKITGPYKKMSEIPKTD